MNLEFFHTFTAKDLPGSDLGLPWSSIILSSGSEPAVNRAVSALGCLHRALKGSSSTPTSGSDALTAPFEQYHKAIVALRKYIDRTPEVGLAVARETTLTATLLLFCFEILSGTDELAMKHLEAAFGILKKTHEEQASPEAQGLSNLTLTSDKATTTNALTQVYLRLASDWLVSGMFHYDGIVWPLQAVCGNAMPNSFQSPREASVHLDALCSEVSQYDDHMYQTATQRYGLPTSAGGNGVHDWKATQKYGLQTPPDLNEVHDCAQFCWMFAMSRAAYAGIESPIDEKVQKTLSDLQQWRTAFSSLVEADPGSKLTMLLEVQYLQAHFSLHLLQDYEQRRCDAMLAGFERVVDIAEKYVHQEAFATRNCEDVDRRLPTLSQLGNNLASSLSFVVEKCRDSNIRRRGINILSTMDYRGVFDMPYLVAYYRHLVDLEEARARMLNPTATWELKCEDVPLKARFRESMFCDCESQGKGDEFYKLNHGRLFYAIEDEYRTLVVGESRFLVNREGPASC